MVHLRAHGVDDLAQVVRGDVRGHADRDARAAVDEQVRERGGEDGGLRGGFVVVGDEINGVLAHVLHERRAQVGQAGLRVTHGGGRVALDAAEVALAVHEALAHDPRLGHVDHRGIDDGLAVGMVVARGVAADLGAFAVLAAREQREIVHRVEDAPLGGFEAVARVGQGAGDDDRHGVVQERFGHLFGHVDGLDFLVGVGHGKGQPGQRLQCVPEIYHCWGSQTTENARDRTTWLQICQSDQAESRSICGAATALPKEHFSPMFTRILVSLIFPAEALNPSSAQPQAPTTYSLAIQPCERQ